MTTVRTRVAGVVLAACMGLGATVAAHGGTELGIRYGRADLTGNDLFPGSGDLGGTPLFGLHAILDVLPLVDVELAGEAYDEDFSFNDGEFGDVVIDGTGNFKDTAILATGKVGLPVTLLGPGSVYGGLGVSAHLVDVEVTPDAGSGVGEDVDAAIEDVVGERTEFEWHAVIGLSTGFPAVPVSAFVELRYQDVLDSKTPDLGSAYLGLNLRLGE